jgi:cellulose 1,4-beta-cellobiosidase
MDLWEANGQAQALTPHPCNATGVKLCTGAACSNDIAVGTCDQGGCDLNPYRLGRHDFYGPGKTIDTRKPFTVVTQFFTHNNRDDGELSAIVRLYKQAGRVVATPLFNQPGLTRYNAITDAYCDAESTAFGGSASSYPFRARGGMAQIGKALGRGMVLVFSIWEDSGSFMQPGNLRGPCSTTSGQPADIEAHDNNAAVTWSNIKFGEIGSTFLH